MRKIIFSEKQIKNILGEDFTCYLDKSDNGCGFPKGSIIAANDEVLTKDPDATDNPTMDKIAAQKSKSFPFYMRSMYGTLREGKKKLYERNHALDGRKLHLGKNTNKMINAISDNMGGNDKMLNNMSSENGATANSLYVRKNRLNKMKKEDPERYERINGKQLEKSIDTTLNNAVNSTKTTKSDVNNKSVERNGIENKQMRTSNNNVIYYQQENQ